MLPPDYGNSNLRRQFKKRKPAPDLRPDRGKRLRAFETIQTAGLPTITAPVVTCAVAYLLEDSVCRQ